MEYGQGEAEQKEKDGLRDMASKGVGFNMFRGGSPMDAAQASSTLGGALFRGPESHFGENPPNRQSFENALVTRLQQARSQSRDRDNLERLAYLLDKHPEVREILGLVRHLNLM